MFSSGKRRPEEEDSLVPHGMIWYATPETPLEHDTPETPLEHATPETRLERDTPETRLEHDTPETRLEHDTPETRLEHDTPETPPEPGGESLEPTIQYAQVMELMRRRARGPAEQRRQENGPEREAAATGIMRPAPTPWWRIPSADPESEPPALSSPTAAVVPLPNPESPAKLEALADRLPSAVSNRAAISEIKNKAAEVKEIKNEVQQGRPARVQVLVGTGSAAVANFTRSSLAQSRRLVAEGRRLYSQAAAKAIRQLPALGWQPPRVRIVLIGLPLRIKILVARQLSEWKMRTPSATPDTGFRAAIILAAACALLGLVCLALAPHFAARFLPSRSLGAGSAVGQKIVVRSVPAAARPSQSAVAAGSAPREKEKPPSSTAAAKAKEEKPAPQNRQAPRKHHRTDDDDYVAPDTYKYYGQSGSR